MAKKKWYTVSFQAKLSEEDIVAMNEYFFMAMAEDMEIKECCALDIDGCCCEQDDEEKTRISLREFVAEKEAEYNKKYPPTDESNIPFCDGGLYGTIWTYRDSVPKFTDDDIEYLKELEFSPESFQQIKGEKMKKCPKCGCEVFYVTAHVCQDWKVDGNGDYMETIEECSQVTHFPADDDIWECANCSHSAPGEEFNMKESKPKE